jgi:hypothetical protein
MAFDIQDKLKKNSKIIMIAVHIFAGLVVFGKGKVLGYNLEDWMTYAGIAGIVASYWIYNMLYTEVKGVKPQPPQPPQPQYPQQAMPQQYPVPPQPQQMPAGKPFNPANFDEVPK